MIKLSQAAQAANISVRTLSDWLARKLVDIPASGTGNHRSFNRNDVIRLAFVSELVRLGVSVNESAKAASAFADTGERGRAPGELFNDGKTILLHSPDGTHMLNARGDGFGVALHFAYGVSNVLVDCNALVARVDAALSSQARSLATA